MSRLTQNAIAVIYGEQTGHPAAASPILQILNMKSMSQPGQPSRYRALFSDGVNFMQGFLGTSLTPLIDENVLIKNSIVRLTKYSLKTVQGRRMILAVEADIVDNNASLLKIGDPQAVDAEKPPQAGTGQNRPAAARQPPQEIVAPGGGPVFPISALNPYQNKWTIMARVTQKSEIKNWSNARGDGKLFSFNLLDQSGEIKVTGFNQQVDEFSSMIEEGKVYFLSGGKIVMAKKQFSTLKGEYEISLQQGCTLIPAPDNVEESVPQANYEFVDLAALNKVEEKETVDVIAVVTEVGEVTSNISQKTNRPVIKRDLTLVDASGYSTRLTLWGNMAEQFEVGNPNPVVAFKALSVSNYNGKSLNAFNGSSYKISPDISESYKLRGWFDSTGQSSNFQAHASNYSGGAGGSADAPKMTFAEVERAVQEMEPQGQIMFSVTGTIVMMSKTDSTFAYPACPRPGCNKKVTQEGDKWRCEKCVSTWDGPEYRYVMGINVADHSGQSWLSAFNDVGKLITGKEAGELMENDRQLVGPTFADSTFKKFNFRCRSKQETYGDEAKTRTTIVSASPLNFVEESQKLLQELQASGF